MKTIVSDELLFDYFAGRVTALQRQQIAEWMHDPTNEERFYRCLDTWERRKPQYRADLTDGFSSYEAYLRGTQPAPTLIHFSERVTVSHSRFFRQLWPLWVAASVLLLLGICGWLFRDQVRYQTISTAYGETRSLRLTDGSQVVLNANSSLRWPRFGFGTKSRDVQLTGEATFVVTHLPDNKRFVVKAAKGVDVVVLGTEFTVFTRHRETKVVLAKGKVLVQYPTTTHKTGQLTLKPGDLVRFDQSGQLKRETTAQPRDFAAWQQHQFVFNNTSLREVGLLLSETYGLQVTIGTDDLARQTLTGSFHADSPDELLQAISNVMSINVMRQNEKIFLTDTHEQTRLP